jgi:hypothetical protein
MFSGLASLSVIEPPEQQSVSRDLNQEALSDKTTHGTQQEFIKLGAKEVSLKDDLRFFEIAVDGCRGGRQYEVEINIKNDSSSPFFPLDAKPSCSCLVGIVKGQTVQRGSVGTIVLRFRPKGNENNLSQFALIECRDSEPIKLQLKGVVASEFVPDKLKFALTDNQKTFEVRFSTEFSDIDLGSVRARSASYLFDVSGTRVDPMCNAFVATVKVGDGQSLESFSDTIVLYWKAKDGSKLDYQQQFTLRFESDKTTVKPRLVRISKNSDSSVFVASFNLYNWKAIAETLKVDDRVALTIENQSVSAKIVGVKPQEASLAVSVEFSGSELSDVDLEKQLHDLTIGFSKGITIRGLRCIIVK